jgi:hypothetical protein
MDAWYGRSRWELADDILAAYRSECVDRALDILSRGERSPIVHEDPNGTIALSHTKAKRKQQRQMARAGILYPHVLNEATVRHIPVINGRDRPGVPAGPERGGGSRSPSSARHT